jgi:leucyl-tRNA synthetase
LTEAYTADGVAVNSGIFDGLTTAEFKTRITTWLEDLGEGARRINYKLRDWLFSRQRYWGEPFPVLHEIDAAGKETGVIEPLREQELPLRLPDMEDFKPSGKPEPPLGKAKDWLYVERNGKRYRRETNTMPQWAGSCWYYLRYIDPKTDRALCEAAKERYWMPVDLYVGGAEHAVLHLLYARFWHKVLFDRGHVHTPEPFQKLVNQGMILGETDYRVPAAVYEANRGTIDGMGLQVLRLKDEEEEICMLRNPSPDPDRFAPLTEEQVVKDKGRVLLKGTDIELIGRADKMSKSRRNVVNPDDVIEDYGADSLRLYEMFMGPLEQVKPWSMRGVEGVYRFLGRVWRVFIDDRAEEVRLSPAVQDAEPDRTTLRLLHQTFRRVTEDLDGMRFNTAIAAMMEFNNHLTSLAVRPRSVLEPFVLLLSPFAPHLAEELWRALGHAETLAYEPWPAFDEALTREDEVEVPVQVNGKLRLRLNVPAGLGKEELERIVLADPKVQALVDGKQVRKVIVVPGRLVNIVVG